MARKPVKKVVAEGELEKAPSKVVSLPANTEIVSASNQEMDQKLFSMKVSTINGMEKGDALNKAEELVNRQSETYFYLGGVFRRIVDQKAYEEKGYTSFQEYVENEFDFKVRHAHNMVSIYTTLTESEIPWDKVRPIKFTKLIVLCEHNLLTPESADEWVEKCSGEGGLSVRGLKEEVKALLESQDTSETPKKLDKGKENIDTLKVNLTEQWGEEIREAIEEKKQELQTTNDGEALKDLVLNGGIHLDPEKELRGVLKRVKPEDAFNIFSESYPEYQLTLKKA